jgi:hypothetical protein
VQVCFYMYCCWRINYQQGETDPIHWLNFATIQDLEFRKHISWSFFIFNDLSVGVVVCFIEIGIIVDHQFKFIFS